MACLKSLEAPLCVVITVVFLVHGLYTTSYKVIESKVPLDDALDTKDMLMTALAIMSLIGTCSSRRAFGVFTLLFMLHAFVFSLFHLFHVVSLFMVASEQPCVYHIQASPELKMADATCHALNAFTLVCTVVSMVATALASMSVFARLTTVTIQITDLRSLATSRSFDNSMPRLINKVAIESEREEDVEEKKPERKMALPDLFV